MANPQPLALPVHANQYRRESFMQGGRPIVVPRETITFYSDGTCHSDGPLDVQTWTVDDDHLALQDGSGQIVDRYCRYSEAVSARHRDHLFSYGSMLVPDSQEFDIDLLALEDNPEEPLSGHLRAHHPGCRRIISRSSQDFFDLFPRNGNYMEVGVGYGNYSKRIHDSLAPAALHLVDCWRAMDSTSDRYDQANLDDAYRETIKKFEGDPRVKIHRGFCEEVLLDLPRDFFDMIYIDANHTEEGCYQDLLMCEPLLKSGGALCGHDYTNSPNRDDQAVSRANYGVISAVDRFCEKFGWHMSHLSIEVGGWCFPSFVLRRNG